MAEPPLSQGIGWGIVMGFGAFFAIVMSLLTLAQKRYLQEYQTSEMFMTAHRSVKTGLVASAVVSSWTWAATLLQSSSVAYKYGVSGPFWYASGATIQVLLFAILAVEVKRKAPNAHTFLEIINARYGKGTHIVFLIFGLLTNIIVTAMLLLGGSAVVNALTGVNIIACSFLLPLGVLVYTLFGGLKATFLTDYVHTSVIFIIILSFLFTVYGSSPVIGSPGKMYDLLVDAATKNPVPDNEQGSYVTMASLQGLIFGIINIVGNFGTVFVDNAYWQRAIAARPSSTVKAYLIGGLAWFSIPFTLATTMGIAGVALVGAGALKPPPTAEEVSAGLVLPMAATALLGKAGAFAVLVLVFMAVTSASSAELIAVSSIYTYDIYRTYIHAGALGKNVIRQSHASVIAFGIIMGGLATILHFIGVDLGYMYLLMGIISSPAVIPVAYTITWKKQTAFAAVSAAILGLVCGLTAWLVTAKKLDGEITLLSTGGNYPMLAGNLTSLIISGLVSTILSLIHPADFDFEITRQKLEILTDDEVVENATFEDPAERDPERLRKAFNFAVISSVILTIILIIIWPLPMYGTRYVFSKPFFTFWVAISMIWAICATISCTIYPIAESRRSIGGVINGIFKDLRGEKITFEKRETDHDKGAAEHQIVEDKA
ncbi:Sodium:solute symporter family-domain-containing protein [Glomus cerebriforme]|uniref:Sodium:solute symporter family-domain-containing protein n=1 Tax=Glomus cerebriforme TaxID=658196 RepID=A0A397TCB4_9GLOM|nr:Sodium:solute symporter family-domain-containing protein [Glomus cerebriforme]